MAFGGIGVFIFLVILNTLEHMPSDYTIPWYVNILPFLAVFITAILSAWIKKSDSENL